MIDIIDPKKRMFPYKIWDICKLESWSLDFLDPWIFWLPVLYLYFVPFIGFQIKYDDDDDIMSWKFRG